MNAQSTTLQTLSRTLAATAEGTYRPRVVPVSVVGDQEACIERATFDEAESLIDIQALTGFPLAIRPTDTGKGVFATRHIEAGEIVLSAPIERRVKARTDTSFEIWPGGHHAELTWPAWRINHSCSPNCGVRARDHRDGGGYDFVAGPFGIAAGDEIRTHYGFHEWISRAVPLGACRCKSPNCEGRARGFGEWSRAERDLLAPFSMASHLTEPDIVRHLVVGIELAGVRKAPLNASGWRGLVTRLVQRCGLRPHGDLLLDDYGKGILSGWTFAQLVNASSITGHYYRQTGQARVDIVSCRAFDADSVGRWLAEELEAVAYAVTAAERA